jgi:protein tyrosine phosphatase
MSRIIKNKKRNKTHTRKTRKNIKLRSKHTVKHGGGILNIFRELRNKLLRRKTVKITDSGFPSSSPIQPSPTKGQPHLNNPISVASQNFSIKSASSPTVLAPKNNLKSDRTFKHYLFTSWPDHGVPEDYKAFEKLLIAVMEDIITNLGTTVIHCSAGVGRTGTFYIALQILIEQGYLPKQTLDARTIIKSIDYTHEFKELNDLFTQDNKKINTESNNNKCNFEANIDDYHKILYIGSKLIKARQKRPHMVQTFDQFKYLCGYFGIETICKNSSYMIVVYEHINKKYHFKHKETALCKDKGKNRYVDILPYADNYVKLGDPKNSTDPCDNYINASEMDPIAGEFHVIATQCPTSKTFNDFKQMMIEQKVKRIVMVTNFTEGEKQKCHEYIENLIINIYNKFKSNENENKNVGYVLGEYNYDNLVEDDGSTS